MADDQQASSSGMDALAAFAQGQEDEQENLGRFALQRRAEAAPLTALTHPEPSAPSKPTLGDTLEDRRSPKDPSRRDPEPKNPSLMDRARRVFRGAVDVDAGISAGVIRAPAVLAGSLMDFGNDTDRFIGEVAASAFARAGAPGRFIADQITQSAEMSASTSRTLRRRLGGQDDQSLSDLITGRNANTASWSDLLSMRETAGKIGNDAVNQGTAVIGASIAPALVTGGSSVAARTVTMGAFGGGVVNDPYSERISNGLQQLGIHTQFTDWLAQDDTDGAFESRFKGAVEGVVAEGLAEGVFWTLKAARQLFRGDEVGAAAARAEARRAMGLGDEATETPAITIREATPEEAAKEHLDISFAQQRTEAARAQQIQGELDAQAAQAEVTGTGGSSSGEAPPKAPGTGKPSGEEAAPGVEELPQGTRSGDAPGDAGEQPVSSVLTDAQEALRRIGSNEELTPETLRLSPDGRVVVSAETKRLADEAGFGRSFAEDTGIPKDDVIFATNGRIVGSMDRTSVTNFAQEVSEWTARGVDDVPANHPAGQFKITPLGNVEDVQPILRAIVDRIPAKTTVSVEEMMAASARVADEVGTDPNAMMAFAEQFATSTDDLYASIGATRTMWSRLATTVDSHLASNVDELGDAAFEAVASDIRNSMVFGGSLARAKSSLGRGLYAARLPDADSYARAIRKGLTPDDLTPTAPGAEPMLPRTREEVKDWLDSWKAFDGDPTGRMKWLEQKFKLPSRNLYLRSAVANQFTANLLSAPRTLALNVVGPAVIGVVRTLEKTSGGYLGALNPLIPAAARRELLATAQAAPVAYLQAFGDMQDALRFGLQALKSGQPVLGGGGSIRDAVGQMGPITPGLLKAANFEGQTWAYSAGNAINLWPRALQKANAGMDEFSKRLSYMGEARATFMVEGATNGLRGKDLNEFVREKLLSSVDSLGHAESEQLLQQAERSTFTGEVGSEGSFSRSFASGVANARKQYPELRFLMPIFNVPANALGETLRRVPGVNVLFKESNRELAGELGPVVQAEAYGRFVSGAAFLGSGYALSRMGLVTGAGPNDPRDRAVWLQTHQPYSLRVGDQWVDYSRYDIVGALFSIPATLFDRTVNQRQDKGWEHLMWGGVAGLAEFMKDRAALQTISDMLTFSSSPTSNPAGFFGRLTGNSLANLAVPNFVTALARNPTDDVIRAKAGLADYIFDKLPVLSQRLDPMRNILGEYVHKPQDSLVEGIAPITMSPANSFTDDPVLTEIGRLNEVTGYAAGVQSPSGSMGGFFDPRKVKLEGGWSLWDEVMRQRQHATVDGMTLREALTDLFESDRYDQALDADASNLTLSTGEESRGALIGKVFEAYNKEARRITASESPIAARWMAVARAKATDDGRLRNVEAREAVENPDLLDSLGIDITNYETKIIGDAQ